MSGVVLTCDGISAKLYGRSLVRQLIRSKKEAVRFLVISIFGGMLIEGVAQWLGKLWIYPYFSLYAYLFFFALGFSLYWLMIVESYLAAKALIDFLRRGKHVVRTYRHFERTLYPILGLLGFALVPISIFLILQDYRSKGGYTFEITKAVDYRVNFTYVIALFLGVWFLLECLQYWRKKTSLIRDILHNHFSPLIAILVASMLLALIMETENIPHPFWVYTNWPYESVRFLGLPVMVFVAWPLHYIAFLSLFRAFTGKQSDEIWRSDLIK
jgi:hypothetical protein